MVKISYFEFFFWTAVARKSVGNEMVAKNEKQRNNNKQKGVEKKTKKSEKRVWFSFEKGRFCSVGLARVRAAPNATSSSATNNENVNEDADYNGKSLLCKSKKSSMGYLEVFLSKNKKFTMRKVLKIR